MTPENIVEFFEALIDDSPDADVTYGLMDSAYTHRNEMRVWQMLMKLDTSITHSPGNTWATEKDLPSDFSSAVKLYGGDSDNEYDPLPFERLLQEKESSNRFALDMGNNKIRLTGSVSSALTMYLFYQRVPTSLFGLTDEQKESTTTIVWPTRFRRLLAYDMAALYTGGIDADDLSAKLTPEQRAAARTLWTAMVAWDTRNRMKGMDFSSTPSRHTRPSRSDVLDD